MDPVESRTPSEWSNRVRKGFIALPDAYKLIFTHTVLWRPLAFVALLAGVLMLAGAAFGWSVGDDLAALVLPDNLSPYLAYMLDMITVLSRFFFALFFALTGWLLALVLTAPVLDLVGARTEALLGAAITDHPSWQRMALDLLESMLYALILVVVVLIAMVFVFVFTLIPPLGPMLGPMIFLGLSSAALVLQAADPYFARRHRSMRERYRTLRALHPEFIGLTLAACVNTMIPLVGLLATPAVTVAATRILAEAPDESS